VSEEWLLRPAPEAARTVALRLLEEASKARERLGSEERDEEALHDGVLADDGFADFSAEFLGPSGTGQHGWREARRCGG